MNSGDRWGPIWHTSDTALAQADGSWITEGAEARQAGGKTAPQCVCMCVCMCVCVGACELGLFTQVSDANRPCPGVPLNWSGWTSHTSHLRKSEQAQKVLSVSPTAAHMEKQPVRLHILSHKPKIAFLSMSSPEEGARCKGRVFEAFAQPRQSNDYMPQQRCQSSSLAFRWLTKKQRNPELINLSWQPSAAEPYSRSRRVSSSMSAQITAGWSDHKVWAHQFNIGFCLPLYICAVGVGFKPQFMTVPWMPSLWELL